MASSNLKSTFYETYPSQRAFNRPDDSIVKASIEDLIQLVGIGYTTAKLNVITNLFEWSDTEIFELNRLSISDDDQNIKKKIYKHIACLCEFIYGLAIALSDNISGNQGLEWQLKYYGH